MRQPQPQDPPQQPPPPAGRAGAGEAEAAERLEAWTATRLMSGIVVRDSHAGHIAATSRCAMGRSRSNVVEQSLQRYS